MHINSFTHLHIVPRLGMRRVIPPLSQYVFIAWQLYMLPANFTLYVDWLRPGRSDDRGSSPGRGWDEFLSSTPFPDRLWGSPSFLSNGY